MIRAVLLTLLLAVSTMAFAPAPAFRTGTCYVSINLKDYIIHSNVVEINC